MILIVGYASTQANTTKRANSKKVENGTEPQAQVIDEKECTAG